MKTLLQFISIFFLSSCSTFNQKKELAKGIKLYEADSLKEAVTVLSNVISINDTCYDGFLYRGWAYKDLKEYDLALRDFNSLIRMHQNEGACYANRASIYYYKLDYANALKDYQKALAIDTSAKILYNPISHMLFITGQKDEACKYYQKALELNDTDFDKSIIEYCRNKNFR